MKKEEIKVVSIERLYKLFNQWSSNNKSVPFKKYLGEKGEGYIGVNNTMGDFRIEEFDTLEKAIGWLENKDEGLPSEYAFVMDLKNEHWIFI